MASFKRQEESVTQKHSMGCGIACVSFVTKKSYDQVLDKYQHKSHAWTRGFYCNDLVKLLAKVGLKYKWRKFKKNEKSFDIPLRSIIFIQRCEDYPYGHFMVKVSKNKYMNPWINHPEILPAKSGFQKKVGSISYVIEPL